MPPFRHRLIAAASLSVGLAAFALPGAEAPATQRSGSWLGETPPAPGAPARPFAPGFISTGLFTRDLAASPDGREIYFTVMLGAFSWSKILFTREVGGVWTEPEVAPFCQNGSRDLEPTLAPDGRHLYFVSDRPDPASGRTEPNFDIWRAERTLVGWSVPRRLDPPIGSAAEEFFPSLTRSGALYFTRRAVGSEEDALFRAAPLGDGFASPERLPAEVNTGVSRFNAWVSPDESLLIIPTDGRPEGLGGTDYFISRRGEEGRWLGARPLGPRVNGPGVHEYSAGLGPDGRQLFFMGQRAQGGRPFFGTKRTRAALLEAHRTPGLGNPTVYWIDASVLSATSVPATDDGAQSPLDPILAVSPASAGSAPFTLGSPPSEPSLFLPGVVSTGLPERDLALAPDGREIHFSVLGSAHATILATRFDGQRWTDPEVAPFSSNPDHLDAEPALSPDGRTLYFLSTRGLPGEDPEAGWKRQNIWAVDRGRDGEWGAPRRLPPCVNDGQANFFPSPDRQGTLYFTRQDSATGKTSVWRARNLDTSCQAEPVSGGINDAKGSWNAAVSPDGTRLVFCATGLPGTLGPADYWVAFRLPNGTWSEPSNLGPSVNGPGWRASSASFSPDGRWLFFASTRLRKDVATGPGPLRLSRLLEVHEAPENGMSDIYAVDARILDALAPAPPR